jgi:subtilisin family serine protease
VPNDPFLASSGTWGQPYADLWGLHKVGAPAGWDTAIGSGAVVGVVDTGVDRTHPDLAANIWTNPGEIPGNGVDDDGNGFVDDVNGWDFADDDNNPDDDHFHGTHCAGTVAAVGNNGSGVVGLAWGARIMAVRGLGTNGGGTSDRLAAAVVYAAENGADVISNSWGGFGISQVMVDAMATARGLGAVVVAAAGNDAGPVDGFEPADIPGVIAVGASNYQDQIAPFSNFGDALTVAAPGVDVLSTRAHNLYHDSDIGGGYLRASGTSMATPHVSALVALLLSAQPGLSVDEVRWHLEVNAHQPGIAGWEGQPWNPYFGWGRIDAAHVFDPVPVLTRLRPGLFTVHAFAGGTAPDVASADLQFTSTTPVPWTLASPPWLPPAIGGGNGDDHLTFSIDGTSLPPGQVTGQVIVNAPTAADGGASIGVTAQIHRDERIGGSTTVAPSAFRNGPRVASDGVGSLIAWSDNDGVHAVRVDGAGGAGPTVELAPGPFPIPGAPSTHYDVDVASDGRNFLVTFAERAGGVEFVRAIRVDPNGQPLDARGTYLAARLARDAEHFYRRTRVAFDGDTWVVLWDEYDSQVVRSSISFRRVGRDGTLRGKRRKLYPRGAGQPTGIEPRLGCARSRCVVAWSEGGAEYRPAGKLAVPALGLTIIGSKTTEGVPRVLLSDADAVAAVTPSADGFGILAWRTSLCPGDVVCGEQIVAGRLDDDGVPVDQTGTRLDVGPPAGNVSAFPSGLVHDGTNWIATFLADKWTFGARMAPDGTRLDDELIGLLMRQEPTLRGPVMAATNTHVLLAWQASPAINQPGPALAQRVLAHPTVPALPAAAIGAIGSRSGTEGEALAFTVSAPALDPDDVVFSATNLPAGAVFDAATRTFRWVPAPDQAGVHPEVHFAASDGVGAASEDVTLTVAEANHSISGTVRFADLSPAPVVLMQLSGAKGGKRSVYTDGEGRYRFDDLPAHRYRIRLDRSSGQGYTATPSKARPAVTDADVHDVDFVITP